MNTAALCDYVALHKSCSMFKGIELKRKQRFFSGNHPFKKKKITCPMSVKKSFVLLCLNNFSVIFKYLYILKEIFFSRQSK